MLDMEFLFSNAYGDYCSLTSSFSNSRKYHGLFVLMDNLSRRVVFQGIGGVALQFKECGFDSAVFSSDSLDCRIYFPYLSRKVKLTFKSKSQSEKRISLMFNNRSIHAVNKIAPNIAVSVAGAGNVMLVEEKHQLIANSDIKQCVSLFHEQVNLYFDIEEQRGYDPSDIALEIGQISFKKHLELVFVPANKSEKQRNIKKYFNTKGFDNSKSSNVFEKSVLHYLFIHGDACLLNAGFHWFGSWGRDTFISLPSFARVTFSKNWLKTEAIRSILLSYLKKLKTGMVPNFVCGDSLAYNTSDAPLLLINAIYEYVHDFNDIDFAGVCLHAVEEILNAYVEGNENVKMGSDFLIENAPQTTWMDAIVDGVPVTPREGKCVEINALWYNALCCYSKLCDLVKVQRLQSLYAIIPNVKKSFQKFWNGEYFFDRLFGNLCDSSFRPNQVIACGLLFTPAKKSQIKSVIEKTERELLTPVGLRTLSPHDSCYKKFFSGVIKQKDLAYHNGAVWPWLIYYYYVCCEKIKKEPAVSLSELLNPANLLCYNHIPEVYDPTYLIPDGCVAQLWSHVLIADLLARARKAYHSYSYINIKPPD